MKNEKLTEKIIGCCFEVINELGAGFLESVYENSLLIALKEKGLKAQNQISISVFFREQHVGIYYADILVEDTIILEIKAIKKLLPEHYAQLINYLKATKKETGLLVNFGNPKLEFKRLFGNNE